MPRRAASPPCRVLCPFFLGVAPWRHAMCRGPDAIWGERGGRAGGGGGDAAENAQRALTGRGWPHHRPASRSLRERGEKVEIRLVLPAISKALRGQPRFLKRATVAGQWEQLLHCFMICGADSSPGASKQRPASNPHPRVTQGSEPIRVETKVPPPWSPPRSPDPNPGHHPGPRPGPHPGH